MKKFVIIFSILGLIVLIIWASLHWTDWTKKTTPPDIRICKVSKANIRHGPGINFEKDTVNQLPYSEMLFVLKDSAGWIKFETNKDVTGWVKKDLTVTKEEWLSKLTKLTTQTKLKPAQQFNSGKITVVKNGSDGYGKKIMDRLEYLNDVKEIVWIEIESNAVYIGFEPIPNDWEMIIDFAALYGNNVTGFGTHVWAVYGKRKGWRPGDSSFIGNTTARHGKIE